VTGTGSANFSFLDSKPAPYDEAGGCNTLRDYGIVIQLIHTEEDLMEAIRLSMLIFPQRDRDADLSLRSELGQEFS
jgi:hypothetical protein